MNMQVLHKGPAISVCIPIYGVEKYIEKCAKSLFQQTLQSIEYIFVNDCTKDKSMDILQKVLDEYPKRKPQVKIIEHATNQGLVGARLTAMAKATGQYLAFCDSDDFVAPHMYEELYQKAISEDFDMVWCDFYYVRNSKISPRKDSAPESLDDYITQMLSGHLNTFIANKIVKADIAKNDYAPLDIRLREDFLFCAKAIFQCRKIAYVPKNFYYYVRNNNSITHTLGEKDYLQQMEIIPQLLKNIAPQRYHTLIDNKLIYQIGSGFALCKSVPLNELITLASRYSFKILRSTHCTKSQKIALILLKFRLKLFYYIFRNFCWFIHSILQKI